MIVWTHVPHRKHTRNATSLKHTGASALPGALSSSWIIFSRRLVAEKQGSGQVRKPWNNREASCSTLQSGAIWGAYKINEETINKNAIKLNETNWKSSSTDYSWHTLTLSRAEENRRVRGTTSSYLHCSCTCKETKNGMKWKEKFRWLQSYVWITFLVLDLSCFLQDFM